jgi:hypothetical protein
MTQPKDTANGFPSWRPTMRSAWKSGRLPLRRVTYIIGALIFIDLRPPRKQPLGPILVIVREVRLGVSGSHIASIIFASFSIQAFLQRFVIFAAGIIVLGFAMVVISRVTEAIGCQQAQQKQNNWSKPGMGARIWSVPIADFEGRAVLPPVRRGIPQCFKLCQGIHFGAPLTTLPPIRI